MLIRICSSYFVAGVVLEDNVVIKTAPIIKYMKGWNSNKVVKYSINKNWKIDIGK